MSLRSFLSDLATAEAYDAPYIEGANQLAHTLLGVFSAVLVALVWRVFAGEMPDKLALLAWLVVAYAFVWEACVQGWRAGDSWFDSAMFAAGAAGVLLPFREVQVVDGATLLALDHWVLLGIVTAWAACFLARLAPRVLGNGLNNDD